MKKEEKEIKIPVKKKQFYELEKQVKETARTCIENIQKDEYFDNEKLYITNLNRGLRLRWQDKTPQLVEFKSLFYNSGSKKKDNPWYIEEIAMELPLSDKDFSILGDILNRLGFKDKQPENRPYNYKFLLGYLGHHGLKPVITVEKTRREYKYKKTNIAFDVVKNLGCFVEVESENPIEIFRSLGLEKVKVYRIGYNDMIAKELPNYLPNEEKQKNFKKDPGWNILPSEKQYVNKLLRG